MTLRNTIVAVAFATASALLGLASTALAAAGPNEGGTNCHGVVLSYLATSGMSPGQLHKEFGVSARDVHATAGQLCGL
jgi:hypothetical protein